MFGRLKNLFRKRAQEEPVAETATAAFPPREFHPGYTPGARPGAAAASPATGAAGTPQPATGDSIRILLKPVLLRLPDALKARVRQPPTGPVQISIPLQKVLAQLAHGSVKMSFGELRLASPAGVFMDVSDQDQTPVELPLPEIIPQLRPEQLPRRAAQVRVEVPEDVSGIFGPKGQPLTSVRRSAAPARASAAAAPPQVAPPSAPAREPESLIRPIAPLPRPPIKPSSPLPAPDELKPPPEAAAPAPQPPPESMEQMIVPLARVAGAWPSAITQALGELSEATVSLPADELEASLKRGRILFTWKRIRSLINPPPSPSAAQALDETQLELPLPVIAPLFMAYKRPVAAQKKYAITEHIPDIFTAKGMAPSEQAQVAAPVMPEAPAGPTIPMPALVAPVRPSLAPPAPPAAPAPAAAPPPPQEIGEVFGQPGRKNWTPSEIVEKTSALQGVAGALIAMQDGLLVAGHLPPGLNSETIAAFLPQMFSRVMQYNKELKFGEANNLTVIVDDVALKIVKTGGVFFTVLGRAGESLPEPQLSIVAAQLGPQNK